MSMKPMQDCTTGVEDAKLLYANNYMKLVSSNLTGMSGFGAVNPLPPGVNPWPPGPRPEPYSWTDPKSKIKWTLIQLDGKWMYQDGKKKLYISPSNLYDLMGVKKDVETGNVAANQVIKGTANGPGPVTLPIPPAPASSGWNLSTISIGGLSLGWMIVLGAGGAWAWKAIKKKRRGG